MDRLGILMCFRLPIDGPAIVASSDFVTFRDEVVRDHDLLALTFIDQFIESQKLSIVFPNGRFVFSERIDLVIESTAEASQWNVRIHVDCFCSVFDCLVVAVLIDRQLEPFIDFNQFRHVGQFVSGIFPQDIGFDRIFDQRGRSEFDAGRSELIES